MIRCDGVATVVDGDSKQNTLVFFHVFCFVVVKECVFLAYPKSAGRLDDDDDDDDDDSQMSEFTIGPLRIMKDPLKRGHMIVGSDLACASPKLLR